MKTLQSIDPKSVLKNISLDGSRLGELAISISKNDLKNIKHGIVILGLCDDRGIKNVGGRIGAKNGPIYFRKKFYKFTIPKGNLHIPIYDLGNFFPVKNIESTHQEASQIISLIHKYNHIPLIIGGGHDLAHAEALGFLHSKHQSKPCFLNIDAHLDVRPCTNGITSGSPWYLVNENPIFQKKKGKIIEFGIQEHCNSKTLFSYANQPSFEINWLTDIKNPTQCFKKLLKKYKNSNLQISLDLDAIQNSDAPGVSAPQTVGFSAKDAIDFSFLSGNHAGVYSFGIYELSPPFDYDEKTSLLAAHCAFSFIKGYAKRVKKRKFSK